MKMKQGELLNIQILPQADDPSFEQRESGMAHTSYREETAFYRRFSRETSSGLNNCSGNISNQASLWAAFPPIPSGRCSIGRCAV